MRSLCSESMVWGRTSEAFCAAFSDLVGLPCSHWEVGGEGEPYLCDMIECERALALDVEVSSVFESVVGTYQDLQVAFRQPRSIYQFGSKSGMHTSLEPPGSLTVVNCSSLYFLNAGSADSSRLRSSGVRALMSGDYVSCQVGLSGSMDGSGGTVYDVCKLSWFVRSVIHRFKWGHLVLLQVEHLL